MPVCPNCGEDNPVRARFCSQCATPLEVASPSPTRTRKIVSIVFSDVVGSTAMGERLDPESIRSVMSRYFKTMRACLERHGGTVEKFVGDAVMALFGIPRLHEDDAIRAVRAAAEMRQALTTLNRELEAEWGVRIENRTGVNTGEVVAGDAAEGGTLALGDAVNVAARLEQAAGAGEILLGEETYRRVGGAVHVEPVGGLDLKGKALPVAAFRLVSLTPLASPAPARPPIPMIGRDAELALLIGAFEQAVRERKARLVTVVGEAGVGKSRLAAEALEALATHGVLLQGRCLSYGEGITYWPVAEAVRQAAQIEEANTREEARGRIASLVDGHPEADRVVEAVSAAIGVGDTSAPPAETFWAVRELLRATAENRPLVVMFDDIQWAEPTLLDLVEYLARRSVGFPLLILCVARPELEESRPSWWQPTGPSLMIRLDPLSPANSAALVGAILGNVHLPEAVRERISEAASGNPLFVEELLAMLEDQEMLTREDGSWVSLADLMALPLPPTISALLSARLEGLPRDERGVLDPASVIGQVFYREAVEEMCPNQERATVPEAIRRLTARGLVGPSAEGTLGGQDPYRFRHILIRDAAYAMVPKQARSEMHEGFATWLQDSVGERITEVEEILGYHLEQAYRYREALGPVREEGRVLATRSGSHLASAGLRALSRDDIPAAAGLLDRAAELLRTEPDRRLRLLPDLAAALIETGEFDRAGSVLSEASDLASRSGDRTVEWRAALERVDSLLYTHPEGWGEEARRVSEEAIAALQVTRDEPALARAWGLLAKSHVMRPGYSEMERSLEAAMEHARLAGDHRQQATAQWWLGWCLFYGPTPATRGIQRCEEILTGGAANRRVEETMYGTLAGLKAMRGEIPEARSLITRAVAIAEDLGLVIDVACSAFWSGPIELLAGDPESAARNLRRGVEQFEQMGEKAYLSTLAAELADALYALGQYEEAERFTRLSQDTAASDDLQSQFIWRAVRAKCLARAGRVDEAEGLGREAVAIAEETDCVSRRADVWMSLSEVLDLAGRSTDAIASIDEALRLYEEKGNELAAARARDVRRNLNRESAGPSSF